MEYLYDKLKKYSKSDWYGFHMPGHKRNGSITGVDLPYDIDITEISGFDDLHHPKGVLQEAEARAAEVYHAEETHYLVNGSTVGILSAVLGCTRPGERVLMSRNCHKSVYNALYINNLRPVYLYPEIISEVGVNGPVSTEEVGRLLKANTDVRAVIITSPTYDGVISDVREIVRLSHLYGIPVILDEAHGAHFGFHPYFSHNGNELGADIVIHSLHKTLPSLTQTALLHINGNIVNRENVRRYLHILQSSSPSYVLMASMDECIRLLMNEREKLFDRYVSLLIKTRKQLHKLKHLKLFEINNYDRSKILIDVSNSCVYSDGEIKKYTGKQLYDELRKEYLLEMEMASLNYIIAMTAPGDSDEGINRLISALTEIDGKLAKYVNNELNYLKIDLNYQNKQIYSQREIEKFINKGISVPIAESIGAVAMEFAYVYPPGIPMIVPGERISLKTAECLQYYAEQGFDIEGTRIKGQIEVLKNG